MRIRTVSIVAAIVVAIASPALAQDESLNRAREYFDKAQTLFEASTYDKAAEYFEKAYDARKFPQFLYNIGVCHEKLQKWQLAIDYYDRYLSEAPSATDKEALRERIAVLKEEVARLAEVAKNAPPADPNAPPADPNAPPADPNAPPADPNAPPADPNAPPADPNAPPADPNAAAASSEPSERLAKLGRISLRGLVVIESEPQGATIYLDSKKKNALGQTPWSGSLDGQHKVFIERKGYRPRETTIYPSPEKFGVYWFGLKEEDYLGWIDIKSNVPGANIYIDDKASGVFQGTPWGGNIKPGKHKIWVSKDGYDEWFQEVEIVRGQTHTLSADLSGAPVGYLNFRGSGIEYTSIYLDGQMLCKRGPCRKPIAEGTHKVEFRRKDHKPYKRTVVVQQKTETTVTAQLAQKPGRGDAITAYVISAGFFGIGVYAGLQSSSIKDDLGSEIAAGNPPVQSDDDRLGWAAFKGGKFWAATANAAYGLGGATLLTAIYYTFRDKGAASTGESDVRTLGLSPILGPDHSGVALGGRF